MSENNVTNRYVVSRPQSWLEDILQTKNADLVLKYW